MPKIELIDFINQEQVGLTTLDLSWNWLCDTPANVFDALCNKLETVENLDSLDLTGNGLGRLDTPRLTRLCQILSKLTDLETLRLGKNGLYMLNATGAELFCKTIANMPNLKYLDFNSIFYHRANNAFLFTPFCLALSGLKKLETLDLGDSKLLWLDIAYVQNLCQALLVLPHLKTLKLSMLGYVDGSRSPLDNDTCKTNFHLLFATLSHLQQLQDLDLSYIIIKSFGEEGSDDFWKALGNLKNLQSVNLTACLDELGNADFDHLHTVFRSLGNLKNLNLSKNSIFFNSCNFTDLFKSLPNLKHLELTDNFGLNFVVSDTTFENFCNSLVYLSSLNTLVLDFHELSEKQFNRLTNHLSEAPIYFRILNKESARNLFAEEARLNRIYSGKISEFRAIVAQGLKLEGDQYPSLPPEVTEMIFSDVFGYARVPEIRATTASAEVIRSRRNNTPPRPNQQQPDPNR